jgi:hypothetical protein
MSYFTKEALEKFQELCAEGVDFGEGPAYDFAMCIKADGDIYGVEPGESCEDGKPISDKEAAKMTPEEMKKAAWIADNTKAPKK